MILHATYMDDEALQVVIDRKFLWYPLSPFRPTWLTLVRQLARRHLREVFRAEITESVGTLRAAFDAGVPLLTAVKVASV